MKMMEIIEALLLKNRTVVTTDFEESMALLAREIPLTIHRYPTGSEYATWEVPPKWDVKKAVLSDGDEVVASYEDHPLFVAPYSAPFTGWVTREELLEHTSTKSEVPGEFFNEHRLSMDYQRRLKEWRISLPHSLAMSLDKPRYFVDIQVEVGPGELLVGEHTIEGANPYTFALLTHLDHTGQANDGLAGVAVGVEVMRRIRQEMPSPKYCYQLLVLPETIGSSIYLTASEDRIGSYLGAVFIEMAGIRSPLDFSHTRRSDTYLDRVLHEVVMERRPGSTEWPFGTPWGNDERQFDSPGVGIPSASLSRHPFHEYHTSGDNLERTDESSLEEMVDVLLDVVRIFELDFIPRPLHRVPVHLTRYNLYADHVYDRARFDLNTAIMDRLWSGKSVFDIALEAGVPYDEALQYAARFAEHGLVDSGPLTPDYFRRSDTS